jgi:hypothetical protein
LLERYSLTFLILSPVSFPDRRQVISFTFMTLFLKLFVLVLMITSRSAKYSEKKTNRIF